MDKWLYWDVTHRHHLFCNPVSAAKVDELGELLNIGPDSRLLDIGCGMGELMIRWSEQHGSSGVGVDLSPYVIEGARRRHAERLPNADLAWVHSDGAKFATDERFDVALCIGASWIWKGFKGTLKALRGFVKPGGLVVLAEPYWREKPEQAYLEIEGLRRKEFRSLAACRKVARKSGLELVWMMGSTIEDWDRYEMLQAAAVDRFAREEPDHPDLAAIRKRRAKHDDAYLRWGRDCLGFATWVFRA